MKYTMKYAIRDASRIIVYAYDIFGDRTARGSFETRAYNSRRGHLGPEFRVQLELYRGIRKSYQIKGKAPNLFLNDSTISDCEDSMINPTEKKQKKVLKKIK